MKRVEYTCENCGKDRGRDSNHWLMLSYEGQFGINLHKWDSRGADDETVHHACGRDCAFQMIDRFLGSSPGSFDRKPVIARVANEN